MSQRKNDAANDLIAESSPYLLQHAHNPVAWMSWSAKAWSRAVDEGKLVLVSIGYSACHWCHVMERESFEDPDLAALMNERFICIKVDREERPDVDQVYMEAVQMLSGHGGWPLNCFCLPDGRPVYGGTYYRPDAWRNLLTRLHQIWIEDKPALEHQAEQLMKGLARPDLIPVQDDIEQINPAEWHAALEQGVQSWKTQMDRREGGTQRAPKFPLPVNWRFLLRHAWTTGDRDLLAQVELTLMRMADGGIFDHVGGGFARYSVDGLWKVPHFEKMLYDNAQLLSLYAEAYAVTGASTYRDVGMRIVEFVSRELTSPQGLFYCALDADSEGEEGLFYLWTRSELASILGDDLGWFAELYHVDGKGLWEHGRNILLKRDGEAGESAIAARHGKTLEELRQSDKHLREKLLQHREKRIRPGLDHKILTGWNGLMIEGLAIAGAAFQDQSLIEKASHAAKQILAEALQPDGSLNRNRLPQGGFSITGFLEDYAHFITGLLALYRATFDQTWALAAANLTTLALERFTCAESPLLYYTPSHGEALVARKMENQDNVIPSSNAAMARALITLGRLFENHAWQSRGQQMVAQLQDQFPTYLFIYALWGQAALDLASKPIDVAVLGPQAILHARTLASQYLPHVLLSASDQGQSAIPLLQARQAPSGQTAFVVCVDHACLTPVTSVQACLDLLKAQT